MAYNLKYRADYETLGGDTCRIEIFEKDYSGIVYPLELSAEPVVQSYQTDEATPVIKGCSLTINLINSGSLPITNFYSAEDDTFKVIHYKNGNVTFAGFLVMEDFEEEMADYKHEIVLSANDNLGLLKDVALNKENIDTFYAFESATFETVAPHTVKISNINYAPTTDRFYITQVGFAGVYNATAVSFSAGVYTVTVSETVANNAAVNGFYGYRKVIDYYGRNNLLSIIQACLFNTGLQLFAEVYCNVFEESFKTDISPLQQTYIDTKTFLEDTKFKSCWDTLTYILNRFKLTLFQSGGKWVIVRFAELRYGNINGFQFDEYFNLIQTVSFSSSVNIGFDLPVYPETAPIKSVIRPYKFDKETFNYQQPKYLLKNNDLLDLGALITSYTTGSGPSLQTIYEYVATNWSNTGIGASPSIFIRIIKDSEDNEIERYLVIEGNTGDTARSAVGVPFEVAEGDKIIFEFTFKTNVSRPGASTIVMALMLTDGTTTRYADENPTVNWKSGLGWNFLVPSGSNTNTNQSVTINPGRIPFSGLIYCYLPQACPTTISATDETQIKDIRVTYTPYINDSTKIIGHYHNEEQDLNIKNNNDETIYLDDSPRSSIMGALFKSSYTGLLQDRTNRWFRQGKTESKRLGEIIVFEQLFQYKSPRAKIEGTFYGLDGVDMFTKINYSPFNSLLFVFGSLEIRYRSNSFDATMYELATEDDSELTSDYTFQYLYNTK